MVVHLIGKWVDTKAVQLERMMAAKMAPLLAVQQVVEMVACWADPMEDPMDDQLAVVLAVLSADQMAASKIVRTVDWLVFLLAAQKESSLVDRTVEMMVAMMGYSAAYLDTLKVERDFEMVEKRVPCLVAMMVVYLVAYMQM